MAKLWSAFLGKLKFRQIFFPYHISKDSVVSLFGVNRNVWKVLCVYSFAIWVYVVACQIGIPNSEYWSFAWWLPWLRMDYLGEAAFALSFIFALLWQVKKE